MTRASRRKQKAQEENLADSGPWLSWRTGLLTNTLVSLVLGVFIFWQIVPAGGLGPALLWAGIAASSIWVIFFFSLVVSRWLRRR